MRFQCTIKTDNAAFTDENMPEAERNDALARGAELARILRRLADRLMDGAEPGTWDALRDANGNAVGAWRVTGR